MTMSEALKKARFEIAVARADVVKWWNRLMLKIAWRLPRRLVEWVFIRVASHATQGKWGTESPDDVSVMEALDRWGQSNEPEDDGGWHVEGAHVEHVEWEGIDLADGGDSSHEATMVRDAETGELVFAGPTGEGQRHDG